MDAYTIAFFGHRYIDNPFQIEERLDIIIERLIRENEYVEFLVGRNGDFDQYVSSTVCRAKKNIVMTTISSFLFCRIRLLNIKIMLSILRNTMMRSKYVKRPQRHTSKVQYKYEIVKWWIVPI